MATTKIALVLFLCLLGLCRGDSEPVSKIITKSFYNNVINQVGNGCTGQRFYTRNSFIDAINTFPIFAKSVTRREIATMFAHVTHETGHFCYKTQQSSEWGDCNASPEQIDCPPSSESDLIAVQSPSLDLLRQSELVDSNPTVAFKKGLSFWISSVRPVLNQGFGATIKAISGMECKGGNPAAIKERIGYYKDYCRQLGVDPGPNLSC